MVLEELLEVMGSDLAGFLTRKERLRLLGLNRAVVGCSFRREVFATTSWTIPPARWLAEQVLGGFTMKNVVTSVILSCGEWQQPLLHEFPALVAVKIIAAENIELLPQHFPTRQILTLDVSGSKIRDLAPVTAFSNLKTLCLPDRTRYANVDALESLQGLRSLRVGAPCDLNDVLDLSFLEAMPELANLTFCDFAGNFGPLKFLKRLEMLDLAVCDIVYLKPLQDSADKLTVLRMSDTLISRWLGNEEISDFFKALVHLQELVIITTHIMDGLDPLSSLVNLTILHLTDQDFDDLSPLSSLTELKSLIISATPGTDWSPIENLKKLESLDQLAPFVTVQSEVAQVLESLPRLRVLSSPVALSPTYSLPQVRVLALSSLPNSEWSSEDISVPLNSICPYITTLRLTGCFDVAALGLSKLTRLRELNMAGLETSVVGMEDTCCDGASSLAIDYSTIGELPNLTKLTLSNKSYARDYKFLDVFVNIRQLDISEQLFNDASVLSNMTHLEKLVLKNTSVEDISPLRNLRKLKKLILDGTKANDVSCLRGLQYLENLSIPLSADCTPLLDGYGATLPSIRKYNHFQHDCKLIDDSTPNCLESRFSHKK